MTNTAENPRAVSGNNEAPDYAKAVTEQMHRDYAEVENTIDGLLAEARVLPNTVDDDESMGRFARIIKRLRDTAARIEAFRIKEKEYYLRGGNAVDGYFNAQYLRCERRNKADKPGAADVLAARLDDYNQRKLKAEQERRRREQEEQDRIARDAYEKAAREAAEAERARLAAERARKIETIEQKTAIADAKDGRAELAKVEAMMAAEKAEQARMATLAKPAAMVRTRIDDALITMGTESYAEVVDRDKLDKAKLWPFLNDDAIAKALRAWAKTTGHTQQMEGANIGKKPKSVVR